MRPCTIPGGNHDWQVADVYRGSFKEGGFEFRVLLYCAKCNQLNTRRIIHDDTGWNEE